ncbi:RNA polymerase sigma factor FliA [Helicobacter monodelphidis]|uniref:RNA polymerase sigma factor FliA n=1 Tax=Helicobacter sp. 15-1451 TaxID=2004995 RepID=UPI000DCDD682|nr:RNA polymerase sigma factor FliA [Helicobacter sp. 15-1451]RAX58128.1 RNA polymerase sigma factor FliA [Helicobacter sp. 15-1451]
MSREAYQSEIRMIQDELAVSYLPAVRAMAFRMKERLPSSVDVDDLISIGAEELIKLSRRYDANKNDSFWGYARTRVQGSMFDYLRSLDVVSRASRRLIRLIETEINKYATLHDEVPSDQYLSELLNEDIDHIRDARVASDIYATLPLDEQLNFSTDTATDIQIEEEELIQVITQIMEGLSERDQLVIQLYYFEELSLREISEVLEITESRISQIHKEILGKIRHKFEQLGGL